MWKTHYATEVPSPANPLETKWFATMRQEKGNRIDYPLLWANLKKDYEKGNNIVFPEKKRSIHLNSIRARILLKFSYLFAM